MTDLIEKVSHVEGAESLNSLVNNVNGLIDQWNDIYDPIKGKTGAILKTAGLGNTKGATVKHALVGVITSMAAMADFRLDDLKKMIKFKKEVPFIELGLVGTFAEINMDLVSLIQAYFSSLTQLDDLAEKLADIPPSATEVGKNAPSEFDDLDFMAKAKMIKMVMSAVSSIKDKVETIMDELRFFKQEAENIKDTVSSVQEDIESGKIAENGKKCHGAKKQSPLECWELINGKIVAPGKGGKGEGAGGCCTTF